MSFTLTAHSTKEASIDEAEQLLGRLQVRRADEIPAVPGFCIARAVFAEPLPAHKHENLTMFVGLPGHPDLALALFYIADPDPGPGLLARTAELDAGAHADETMRVTRLRSGPRTINGIAGEELGERVREFNFTTGYSLYWETPGVPGDLLQPHLALELQTGVGERSGGKPVDSSLHEDALLALWDSISSTIRLRTADPPPPGRARGPEGPTLGAAARAGDACPQSGWWECAAGGDGLRVRGGAVQFVRKGERMPQALLLPRQTLWQTLRGLQPGVESAQPTAWRLVDRRARPRVAASPSLAPAGDAAPGGAPVAGRGAPVGAPVDEDGAPVLRTGQPCPASGWWRCEEAQALDGTRWFAAGSLLPAATFSVPGGVFGRRAGPATIQRRSRWQLVRAADDPPAPA